jgi:Protein of unknown function (DUF2793)
MAQETITAQDIMGKSVDRNRYFRGKLLSVRDLTQEQDYFNSKRWLLNRLLFGAGVICGLQVEKAGSEVAVLIKAGLALDPLGREVTVIDDPKDDRKVNLADIIKLSEADRDVKTKTGYICLSHRDCPKEPAPSFNASPCAASCESSRWHETYDVSWEEEADPKSPPPLCASWLNRLTVQAEDENVRIERTAPLWVRADDVFEVVVRVTATAQKGTPQIRITQQVSNGTIIEPVPRVAVTGQFPTPPVSLKDGEFFVYIYQVKAPASPGLLQINTPGLPNQVSTVNVVSEEDARKNESQFDLQLSCPEPRSTCVRIAKLKIGFADGKPVDFSILDFPRPRFRYNLERVTEMLDCVRASLTAAAGSPRPGHAFVTFNDFDTDPPMPIGPNANAGTGFTFSGGNHAHALLRAKDSGLEFTEANELRIEGAVGGTGIKFLRTVEGVSPIGEKDLVTKDYVDAHIAGLDWQESVLSKDKISPPPAKDGDRYLLFNEPDGAWKKLKGKKNDIATFTQKTWEFTTPDKGTATFVEDENKTYMFVDGSWIPFLAAPSIMAGDGLVASNDAILSVGKGKGIEVSRDAVAVAFETKLPQPIGPEASAGSSESLSAGDHVHTIVLPKASGLIFDDQGLRVDGPVRGDKIRFLSTVNGQDPTEPTHLATRKYVDEHQIGITAGDGLVRKENTISVGQGPGIKVNADNVAVMFDPATPRPVGPEASAGTPRAVAAFDHVHTLQLSERGGLVFDGKGLRIEGIVTGETINFANPVAGSTPRLNEHLATKAYVDQKVVPPASVVAGNGLVEKDHTVSVGQGDGILVGQNSVAVRFSDQLPQPDSAKGNPGQANSAARSDHAHPRVLVTTGAATGVVTYKLQSETLFSAQAEINPGLGAGHLSVQLAVVTSKTNYAFLSDVDLGIDMTTEVRPGTQEKSTTFVIRIDSKRSKQPLPNGLQIRWFAYTPEFERPPTEVEVTGPVVGLALGNLNQANPLRNVDSVNPIPR